MRACIYARTCRREKVHHTTSILHQIEHCQETALRHNRLVHEEHLFTDIEKGGALLPSCWAPEGQDSRPALSAMIQAIEVGEVRWVVVDHLDALGTSSDILTALRDLFVARRVTVFESPSPSASEPDVAAAFAWSILAPCVQRETEAERERRESPRNVKIRPTPDGVARRKAG